MLATCIIPIKSDHVIFTSCVSLQEQCTPVYVASAKGFNDVVKSLIAANADVNCACNVSYHVVYKNIEKFLIKGFLISTYVAILYT